MKTKNKGQIDKSDFQADLKYKVKALASLIGVVLIIIGLYLILGGIVNIVNRSKSPGTVFTDNNEAGIMYSDNNSINNVSITGEQDAGSKSVGKIDEGMHIIDGESKENGTAKKANGSDTISGLEKARKTKERIDSSGKWSATDYAMGDILEGVYQVKKGDTLWEISEAVYGQGSLWKIILEENKDKIGFLPNGSRALIITGQVLIIPKR